MNSGMTEDEAAIKIEAIQRGRRDRARVAQLRQEKREQEEEEERQREEAAEMQRQMEEEQEAREEAARQAEEKKRKKKKKGVTAGLGEHHKVHPDDVELVEPRDVGSRAMLRNLHIGNRKVRCNRCDTYLCVCVCVCVCVCANMRVHARARTRLLSCCACACAEAATTCKPQSLLTFRVNPVRIRRLTHATPIVHPTTFPSLPDSRLFRTVAARLPGRVHAGTDNRHGRRKR